MNGSTIRRLLVIGLIAALSQASTASTVLDQPMPTPAQPRPAEKADAGFEELALASKLLDQGETAQTAEQRREAYLAAERHADLAVQALPQNADAHFLRFAARGRLAQMQGLARAALQLRSLQRELDVVLALEPDHAGALSSRGGMLVKLPWMLGGDVPEGIRMLKRSLQLNPGSVGTRLELAEAYHIQKDDAQALAMLNEAREIAIASGSTRQLETVRKFSEALENSCEGCELEVRPR